MRELSIEYFLERYAANPDHWLTELAALRRKAARWDWVEKHGRWEGSVRYSFDVSDYEDWSSVGREIDREIEKEQGQRLKPESYIRPVVSIDPDELAP